MIKTKIFVITKFNPANDDEKTVVNMKHNLGTESYIFSSLGKACVRSFALGKAAEPAREGLWVHQWPESAPQQLAFQKDGLVSHSNTESSREGLSLVSYNSRRERRNCALAEEATEN